MESDGVVQLYERSLKKGIRYNPFIGDGDSSSYSAVEKMMPYGVLYPIRKQECVNHVTKRMGTGLRALTRDYKGGYFFKYTGDVRCFGYHFIRTFANSNEMSSPLRVRNSGRQCTMKYKLLQSTLDISNLGISNFALSRTKLSVPLASIQAE